MPRDRRRSPDRSQCWWLWVALAVLSASPCRPANADTPTTSTKPCSPLELPIDRIGPPPTQYVEFCEANRPHCEMSGQSVIDWTAHTSNLVSQVNGKVNAGTRLEDDKWLYGCEDRWSFPLRGAGDCEDFALEKRRRLVESGLPRGAMTMAIVYHRTGWGPHAILLIETSVGTFVLDNLRADLACWNDVPYNYETRERQDGRWTRFDQTYWKR